jgi:hypothetical protein
MKLGVMKKVPFFLFSLVLATVVVASSALAQGSAGGYAAKMVERVPGKPASIVTVHQGQIFRVAIGSAVVDSDAGCTFHYNGTLFLPGGFYPCFTVTHGKEAPGAVCANNYYPGLLIQNSWAQTGKALVEGCTGSLEFLGYYTETAPDGTKRRAVVGAFSPRPQPN